MPFVGPLTPGPVGDPLEPLPMVPTPCVVGLVAVLRPDAPVPRVADSPPDAGDAQLMLPADEVVPAPPVPPVLLLRPLALLSLLVTPLVVPGAQSLLPAADAPGPLAAVVEPPEPEPGWVLDSTELPLPSVLELTPEEPGVEVCAQASCEAASSAASNIDVEVFMLPPWEYVIESPCTARSMPFLPATTARTYVLATEDCRARASIAR